MVAGCSSGGSSPTKTVTVAGSAPATSSTTGPKVAGYGQNASAVAHRLTVCAKVKRFSRSIARCTHKSGSFVVVATTDDETTQTFLVAKMQDSNPTDCDVVYRGVIIGATSRRVLRAVLGDPAAFATATHGRLRCPIGP